VGERAGLCDLRAVAFEDVLGLALQVHQLRHAGLHAESHFILRDARDRLGVAEARVIHRVQFAKPIEHRAAVVGGDAGRVLDVEHRVCAAAEGDAVVPRREEAALPHAREERLRRRAAGPARCEDNEARQIIVLAAEAVAQPRAKARAAGHLAAGHHKRAGRVVVDGVGVDAADDRELIGHLRRVREQLAHPRASLAVLGELEHGGRDRQPRLAAGHRGDALAAADGVGQVLVEVRFELRLVIPHVDLRRPAVHVQVDEPLGLGRVVRQAGEHGMNARATRLGRRTEGIARHGRERDGTGAQAGGAEELAAGVGEEEFVQGVHGKVFSVQFSVFSGSAVPRGSK
jgi:hypothetical protein